MESKLNAYRSRKRRVETINNIKEKLVKMIPFYNSATKQDEVKSVLVDVNDEESEESPACSELDAEFVSEDDDKIFQKKEPEHASPTVPESKWLKIFWYIVIFSFWATCYAIAIELKFGIVFLMFSALCGLYLNTRTGPKKRNEISAYSVFNENCEPIDGTLNAEQFENEIRYGFGAVR